MFIYICKLFANGPARDITIIAIGVFLAIDRYTTQYTKLMGFEHL